MIDGLWQARILRGILKWRDAEGRKFSLHKTIAYVNYFSCRFTSFNKYFCEINFLTYVVKYREVLFVDFLLDSVTFCFSGGGGINR
jgi:hypothetical protein